MISGNADRRLTDRASGQSIGSKHVTNSLTQWLTGLASGIVLLVAFGGNVARAQDPEPVVVPVVEADGGEPTVEPVVEPQSASESSEAASRSTPVVDPPSRVAR